MGLRDALKARLKAVIGAAPAAPAPAASAPAASAPAASAPAASAPAAAAAPVPADAKYTAVGSAAHVKATRAGSYAYQGGVVAVFRFGGRLYAIDNACAHEDGPIGEGDIDGCKVRCPYHDWQYDFTTGACLTDPERQRATYAVREADGQIWIGPQLTPGSESRGGDHDDGLEVIRQ